jgi:hypothetical protein
MKNTIKNIFSTLQLIPLENGIRVSSINLINLPLDILLLIGIIIISLIIIIG